MPIPTLRVEDIPSGLPRQPVPLRLAYLITGLSWANFTFLLTVRQEERYEYLTGYEYAAGAEPRKVRRHNYERILGANSDQSPEAERVALLPRNHFVWSDDLADAFSLFIRDCPGPEDAQRVGMGLSWNPALHGLDTLIADCVDLSDLAPAAPAGAALSQRDLRKQATQARHARWRQAYDELKQQHPRKSNTWISQHIEKQPIAEGRDAETIRRNMTRK